MLYICVNLTCFVNEICEIDVVLIPIIYKSKEK